MSKRAQDRNGKPLNGGLPVGWSWTTTDELFSFVTSGSRGWAKYYSHEGPMFLRIGNLDHAYDLGPMQHGHGYQGPGIQTAYVVDFLAKRAVFTGSMQMHGLTLVCSTRCTPWRASADAARWLPPTAPSWAN